MYIRMTGGRDSGEVKEFSFDDAQALLKNGHAVPVDFNEGDPLAKRNVKVEEVPLPAVVPPRTLDTPAVMAGKTIAMPQKARRKF